MKNILPYLIAVLLVSCTTVTDITPPAYASKLVVNGLLSNEESIRVSISYSVVALSQDQPQYLSDAVVEVWEDGTSLGKGTYNTFDKVYEWSQVPKAGSNYRVRVEHKDYPVIDQSLDMPSANAFSKIIYEDSIGLDSSGLAKAAITIHLADPSNETNYYRLNFGYYNSTIPGFLPITFETNDAILLAPSTVKEDDGSYLFNDQLFNGQTRDIKVTFTRDIALSTPRFLVLGESLSEDLYLYQYSIALYQSSKNNFISEPVIIHNNIKGGLGIWAGKITERDTIY
ncbi:MAG: DUF4249 family protein [Bacteroidetes bacterium]|nr:DUF4249 family protein [Bacteroidota bacterium]